MVIEKKHEEFELKLLVQRQEISYAFKNVLIIWISNVFIWRVGWWLYIFEMNNVEAAYRKSPILQIFPKFPNHWLIYFYKNILR